MLTKNHFNDPICSIIDKLHESIRNEVSKLNSFSEYEQWCKGSSYKSYMSDIEQAIKDRFGINLKMERNPYDKTDSIWFCDILNARSSNVLLSEVYCRDEEVGSMIRGNNYKASIIDDDRVFIKGFLSTLPSVLHHSYFQWFSYQGSIYKNTKRLPTAREVSSVFFHEFGHIWTHISLAHKTDRINLFLNDIAISLHNSKPAKDREVILLEMEKENLLDKKDVEELIKEERAFILGPKLFKFLYNKTYCNSISKHYSNASSERVADDFAMKFGYGEEMLNKTIHSPDYKVRSYDYKDTVMDNIGLVTIVGFILTAFAPFAALFYWSIPLICVYTYCVLSKETLNEHQYDWSSNYSNRIKYTYINELKDKRISSENRKAIVEKLDIIDKMLKKVKPLSLNNSIFYKLARLLFKDNRTAIDTKQEEIMLEELASNSLFYYSAKLKTSMENISTEALDNNYFIKKMKEIAYDKAKFQELINNDKTITLLRPVSVIEKIKKAVCFEGMVYLSCLAEREGLEYKMVIFKFMEKDNPKIWWHSSTYIKINNKWSIIDWPNDIRVVREGNSFNEVLRADIDNYLKEDDWVYVEVCETDVGRVKNGCTFQEFLDANRTIVKYGKPQGGINMESRYNQLNSCYLNKNENISTEASAKRNRKGAEAFILKYIEKILPGGKSIQIYKDMFKRMNDKEFEQYMLDLKSGKQFLVLIAPNFTGKSLSTERNIRIAEELGHKFFQRLYIGPQGDNPGYLTPIKYLVVDLPMRRQSQTLIKKISISETNRRIDKMTGQLASGHDTKASRITYPEIQLLAALGMDASLVELLKYRGGDIAGNNAMNAMISKTGHASLVTLHQYASGVESTKTLSSILHAMHLKNNLRTK